MGFAFEFVQACKSEALYGANHSEMNWILDQLERAGVNLEAQSARQWMQDGLPVSAGIHPLRSMFRSNNHWIVPPVLCLELCAALRTLTYARIFDACSRDAFCAVLEHAAKHGGLVVN